MSNQPETNTYDAGVYQLEIADPVQGGVGGLSNTPLLNLANRTHYLKSHMDALEAGTTIPPTVAPLNSPAFTGSPTAPTLGTGDGSTKIATTAFVQDALGGIATVNVAGSANVTLSQAQWGKGTIILTGAITANINVVFPTQGDGWLVINSTTGAFSITCKTAAGTGIVVAQGKSSILACDGTNIVLEQTDYTSVALTGNPTAPTQTSSDNTTKIATTAFVQAVLAGISSGSFGNSGYAKIPGGLIIQWVTFSLSPGNGADTLTNTAWASATINWPTTFTNNCFGAWAAPRPTNNGQFVFGSCTVLSNTQGLIFLTAHTDAALPITGIMLAIGN